MTKEESIAILDGFKHNPLFNEQHFEALDMAISALSENKGDLIRQAEDYENEIVDLHNRLDIAEYDKERYKEEITILEAKNKGEWIPVSERLPENGEDVLVYDDSDIFVAWYSKIVRSWGSVDDRFDENTPIIAWQPLPEPYQKGGE